MPPIPSRTPSRRYLAAGLLSALLLAGCGGGGGGGGGDKTLIGAGSTLVAPLVAQWSGDYQNRAGVTVTYGAIGSGGGIAQITARTVDFGASDAPMTTDQADSCKGCVQIPWALAATVVAYNVNGVTNELKLSGPVLAKIYLGQITRWNDPAIARLNPTRKLPNTEITTVHRSDGSGDTYAFSDFLAKVSPEWKSKEGVSTQISFPTGVGAKGNDGVTATIAKTDGSIGYLGISYVFSNDLNFVLVENAAGKFPPPALPSIAAAAKTVTTIPPDNAISITDPPASAPDAYPISTFTYAIVPESSAKASTLRAFLTYAVTTGQKFAPPLNFAILPAKIVTAAKAAIAKIQ
jgi:phosphate transport system substrate-binding protein